MIIFELEKEVCFISCWVMIIWVFILLFPCLQIFYFIKKSTHLCMKCKAIRSQSRIKKLECEDHLAAVQRQEIEAGSCENSLSLALNSEYSTVIIMVVVKSLTNLV